MNKEQFLAALRRRLGNLPAAEVEKSLDFYDEWIDDACEEGQTAEEAVEKLGPIDKIAENIMYDMSLPTLIRARVSESQQSAAGENEDAAVSGKQRKRVLFPLMVILASPIWLPLLLAAIIIIFSVYIVIWALIIALFAAVYGVGLAGAVSVIASSVAFSKGLPAPGFAMIGAGLILVAICLFAVRPTHRLAGWLCKATPWFARKIKSLLIQKGGENA